jgi:hypothetical protein
MQRPPVRVRILTWIGDETDGVVEGVYYPPAPGDVPNLKIMQVSVLGRNVLLSYEQEIALRERLLDDGTLEETFGV